VIDSGTESGGTPVRDIGPSAESAEDAGRTAARETLRVRLASAPAEFLRGALANPSLGDEELVLLLRNRAAEPETLRRIGGDRRRTVNHVVRRLLCVHPSTPLVVARNLLPFLSWSDLAEVTRTPSSHAVLRQQAEKLLRARLGELNSGERVALARRATRGLIADLLASDDDRVLRGLLHNGRLIERDAVRIAERSTTGAALLEHLVTASTWGTRRAVRLAVLENPRTPIAVALGLLRRLDPRDLRRVATSSRVPRVVRVGAGRRLEADDRGAGRRVGGA